MLVRLTIFTILIAWANCTGVTAQPPPKERSPGELIVGEWLLTKVDGRSNPAKTFDMIMSFTSDGKFKSYARGKNGETAKSATGSYRVVGDGIELSAAQPGDGAATRVPIIRLTTTELVLDLPGSGELRRMEYVREKTK